MKAGIVKRRSTVQKMIDRAEALIGSEEQVDCPVKHVFTPGLYSREIFIPKGTYLTSKIHKTEHPFILSKGKISVFTEEDGEVLLVAPYSGITYPGTRRVLYAHEDVIWTTFHVTNKTDLEEIENDIIEQNTNKLLNQKKGDYLCLG